MGDAAVTLGAEANRPFSAEQIFDTRSIYGRMRGSLKPEAKLRGFFHSLAVAQKDKQFFSEARPARGRSKPPESVELVVMSGAPDEAVNVDLTLELTGGAGRGRMLLLFRIKDRSRIPPEGTACRALLLTKGMVERLCGHESTRTSELALRSISDILSGRADGDPFEAARILAAVPELDGKLDEGGFCKFKPFDLPEQAGHVDELPERMVIVVVIDRPRG